MRKRTAGLLTAAGLLAVVTAGTYTVIASHYTEHFFENTSILWCTFERKRIMHYFRRGSNVSESTPNH